MKSAPASKSKIYQKVMIENLAHVTSILEKNHPQEWCIAYGTLLGWFRGRRLIPWDGDCDVLLWGDQINSKLRATLEEIGSVKYCKNSGIGFYQCRTSANAHGSGQTDIFIAKNDPFSARMSIVSYGPGEHLGKGYYISSTFMDSLEEIPIRVPNCWKSLLSMWYPFHEVHYPDYVIRPKVLVNMCGDPFHHGHSHLIHRANFYGRPVVGIHNDETIRSYKGIPLYGQELRYRMARQCVFTHDVLENLPLPITSEYLDRHDLKFVVHGDDHQLENLPENIYQGCQNRVIILPRTEEISSSDIRSKSPIQSGYP